MINYTKRNYIKLIFIIFEAVFFCLIFFSGLAVNVTSYISICLCFLYAFISFDKTLDNFLITLGLIFTVGADTLLVLISNGDKVIAMWLFLIVQIIYLIRLLNIEKKGKLRYINLIFSVFFVFITIITSVLVLKKATDTLSILSTIYYAMLISNVIFSLVSFRIIPLFSIGLVLFALCDLIIGLNFLYLYFNIPEDSIITKIISIPFNLAWIFYLPSQVLIAMSGKRSLY